MNTELKEIGKYESKDGNMRVFLGDENEFLCAVTTEELAILVGFKSGSNISDLIRRNPKIKTTKFSRIELMQTAGGIQETRLFTERGILEVAFLASTEKAEKFRDDIYDLLVNLREKNMISFGANGLDVKLLEQVKESNERVASIGAEAIKEMERFAEAEENLDNNDEKIDYLISLLEKFEKDREAIKNVEYFEERLVEREIEVLDIQKELKKIPEIFERLEKIEKSQKAMDAKIKKMMGN